MSYNVMGNDYSNEFGTQDVADNKVISILAYIPLLFWIPLVAGNTPYGRFHANQGLLLTLASFALGVVNAVISLTIGWIPIVGAIIAGLVSLVCSVSGLGLMIYGMVCTGQGFAKELPFIGGLAQLIRR